MLDYWWSSSPLTGIFTTIMMMEEFNLAEAGWLSNDEVVRRAIFSCG
jgi:hypothetical protein